MQDAGRAVRDRLGQFAAARPGLVARLRLFGLLALLIVLFAGLQYLVGEGTPRVQVRVVTQDVPVFVPVERIVERVIERPVYVPVPGRRDRHGPARDPDPDAPAGRYADADRVQPERPRRAERQRRQPARPWSGRPP